MPSSHLGDEQILVLAPTGRDGAAAELLLRGAGLEAVICPTLAALCQAVETGQGGAALVAEEAFATGDADSVTRYVATQPPWSDFPFILLTHQGARRDSGPHRMRLLASLGNVTLLDRPIHAMTLLAAVRAALRARRHQYEAARYLHDREQAAARLEELVGVRTRLLEDANQQLRGEITERKAAQRALEAVQESLTIALDAARMGTWDLDLATDRSRRSLRHDLIFGYRSLQPAWGRVKARQHVVPEDQAAFDGAFERALGDDRLKIECRITWPQDGSIHWIAMEGRVYRDTAGKPVRMAGVIVDATDQRTTEESLRQAMKMEAVGQLTGGVAHDFNNLLTAVLGNLEMAQRRVGDEAVQRALGSAMRAARRGAELTQQLLAFSRRQHLAPQAVDINELVSGMGDLLFRTIGTTIRIETVLEKDLWPALIDPTQLEMIILNLALNARDAMPDGGRLTIATKNIAPGEAPWPTDLASGEYVSVSIKDSGTGMTEEVRAKAFEPFYTTKGVGRGTGLGLSQAYGVARQSGGTVTIETGLGSGTAVTVYLPRTKAAPAAATEAPLDGAAAQAAQSATILVVDDDPDVRGIAVLSLQELGYKLLQADSGAAALATLAQAAPIDLVLIDFAMPGMDGGETAAQIRSLRPNLPLLFMTGYADVAALDRHIGEDEIIRKPFKLTALAERVAATLARHAAAPAAPNVVALRVRGH